MIFHEKLATKVLNGEKTVHRGLAVEDPDSPWCEERCFYQPGVSAAIKTGRSKPALGLIRVTAPPRLERLSDITADEARYEGFESVAAYMKGWNLPPHTKVWRVEFELVRHGAAPVMVQR